tara:strand:- start:84 stop:830 length:747 start_codon:yes stop_codon:yes gene_type:complete
MKVDAVKYSIRGLIKATHVALSRGKANEDRIKNVSDEMEEVRGIASAAIERTEEATEQVVSIRDDIGDLVNDEVSNVISDYVSDELNSEWLSEMVTDELAGFGIDNYDWKRDLKSEILDAIADDDNDFSGQLDAHGNLITDLEEKVATVSSGLEDKIDTLGERLEGTLSEMEDAYCDLPATVEAVCKDQYEFEEELRLHEHRLGSLERKLGVHPEGFKKDDPRLDELVNAVQKLYELNGMDLNFGLED